jgi:hypothetical protein
MALRLRFALVTAALVAVVVGCGSVAFALSMSASTRSTVEYAMRGRARRVGEELSAHLLPLPVGTAGRTPSFDQSMVQVIAGSDELVYTTAAAGSSPLISARQIAHARTTPVWVEERRTAWDGPHLVLAEAAGGRTTRAHNAYVVVVGASLDQLVDTTHRVDLVLELAGPLAVLACAAGAWFLAGRALRPVDLLRRQVQDISTGDLRGRLVDPGTRDELAALADTFNDLLDRLSESIDHEREFVAAASHELRTPLAALSAELELALRGTSNRATSNRAASNSAASKARDVAEVTDVKEVTERLASRVAELVRLADGLLTLAQTQDRSVLMHVERQLLEPLVAESLANYRAVAARNGVTMVLDAEPSVVAAVDAICFREVVENLVDNAVRYSPSGAFVDVGLYQVAGTAVLEVRDNGPGFPTAFIPRAFERFSRADPSRSRDEGGAGLGLAIVQTIVTALGGTVTLSNNTPGRGALVTVTLPVPAGAAHTSRDPL